MKVVLASDNHYDIDSIKRILNNEPMADYYLHCGDSSLLPEDISPFASVEGNNDRPSLFPRDRIVNIENHNIYIVHGHREVYFQDLRELALKAKEKGCDIVFFGHTHCFTDVSLDGVRLINPGSTYYNRDRSEPCYAVVYIDKNTIKVEKKVLDFK